MGFRGSRGPSRRARELRTNSPEPRTPARRRPRGCRPGACSEPSRCRRRARHPGVGSALRAPRPARSEVAAEGAEHLGSASSSGRRSRASGLGSSAAPLGSSAAGPESWAAPLGSTAPGPGNSAVGAGGSAPCTRPRAPNGDGNGTVTRGCPASSHRRRPSASRDEHVKRSPQPGKRHPRSLDSSARLSAGKSKDTYAEGSLRRANALEVLGSPSAPCRAARPSPVRSGCDRRRPR